VKTLDRYILKNFLGVFAGSLITVAFLFTALSVLDGLTYLMGGKGASFLAIVRYYSLQLPQTVYMTAPVSALLASMITLGSMNQRCEIMAIRAGGVSIARAALPIVAASFFIAGLLFLLGDTLVPYGNRYFLSQKTEFNQDDEKEKTKEDDLNPGAWYVSESGTDGPVILRLDRIDRKTGAVTGLTAYRVSPEFDLREQVTAKKAVHAAGEGWKASAVAIRRFRGQDVPAFETRRETILDLPDTPEDLMRVQRAPEEMSLGQINDQIARIHRYGLPDQAFRVERQARFAIPLAAVILVLVGSPLAIRPVRTTGLAVSILGAVIVGFAYYVIIAEFISLGKGGLAPPAVAAWTANAIFGVAGLGLFSGMKK
jgi:lipopolysaccharide export system permease protein